MTMGKYIKRTFKPAPIKTLVSLDDRTFSQITRISQSFGITRSKAIRYAIKYAYYTIGYYSKYVVETGKKPSHYLQKKYNLMVNNLEKGENIIPRYRVNLHGKVKK